MVGCLHVIKWHNPYTKKEYPTKEYTNENQAITRDKLNKMKMNQENYISNSSGLLGDTDCYKRMKKPDITVSQDLDDMNLNSNIQQSLNLPRSSNRITSRICQCLGGCFLEWGSLNLSFLILLKILVEIH